MKATSLLEKQHRTIEAIFKKLESGKGDASALVKQLADDLAAHMAIEQELFYPAVRALKEDLVAESFEEHAVAELALKRLLATPPGTPTFKARVTTLKELIEHHVEEEEDDLFPTVEKKMDAGELSELGKQMKAMFDESVKRGFEALVPKTMASTSADLANKPPQKRSSPANGKGRTRETSAHR